ncbi:MAG: thioredoxin family protein [Bacteroidetes bacterium]|nr:thioredoxin family protein [Bacteroidota bacterium]
MKSIHTPFRSAILALSFHVFFATFLFSTNLEWEENSQFGVEIGGRTDVTAQVFQPTNYQPFMILTSKMLPAPVLVDLAKKRVYTLNASMVSIDGSFLKTTGIPKGKEAGGYSLKGATTSFKVKGKQISLVLRQTLVGEVSREVLLAHSPDYSIRMNSYKPRKKAISALSSYKKKTEFVVMFATWCSTCKFVVPTVMRILEDANNPAFSVRYIGIAMGGNEPAAALERYGHDYPALIVYQNGREVDRIIADPPGAYEEALVNILK